MAQWRIKELSNLTGVSVRALHHYDKIGLLKPSTRSSNGYRYYAQKDLVTLQQITALKFFGFGLSQIKTMVQYQPGILEHLQTQQEMLKDQVAHLQQAQEAMETTILRMKNTKSFEWQDLISLIEGYRMTEELKKTWQGRIFNQAQLAEWVALKKQYPKEFEMYEKLIDQINSNQLVDPEGPDGERVVKGFFDFTKKITTEQEKFRTLNSQILRGIKEGKITNTPLSPEGNLWVAKAQFSYFFRRCNHMYQEISNNLKADPTGPAGKKIAKEWRELIEEALNGASHELGLGLVLWQEAGRQQAILQKRTTPLTAQEQVKETYAKIYFDPEALSWIDKALNAH